MPVDVDLRDALTVGAEWFGADHPILKCLQLGVAIHHGALPGPFRREVERLLQRGSLKVTIASPTLAQGLNLYASAVLFHGLHRGRDLLKGSEFANVIGRAGRAFVDTEGLVLYPVFAPNETHRRDWLQLTAGDGGKALRSGLIEVGVALLRRMYQSLGFDSVGPFLNYLTGGLDWSLPILARETDDDLAAASVSWQSNLALLDIGILSTVGDSDLDIDADAATQSVADALHGSLWERQLQRFEDATAATIRGVVNSRTRHLWQVSTPSQRRGWFLAGVGADAGMDLAQVSGRIIALANEAEAAILRADYEVAAERLGAVAETVFALKTFAPETSLDNWRAVMTHWVQGLPLADVTGDRVAVAQFIESDLVYRLVWGIEAARVFETAQGNVDADMLTGAAVTAVETGTFNRAAAILIRSGFDHRLAAVAAVASTGATFESAAEMRQWISDLDPFLAGNPDWPTPESRSAWEAFTSRARAVRSLRWRRRTRDVGEVTWHDAVPEPGTWLRVSDAETGKIDIWSTGFDLLGEATVRLNPERQGVLRAQRHSDGNGVQLVYRGPGDLVPG